MNLEVYYMWSVGSKNEKAGNFGQLKSGKTVLKIKGTIFPIKDRPRLVNSTSNFFLILTKEPEWFRAAITARSFNFWASKW